MNSDNDFEDEIPNLLERTERVPLTIISGFLGAGKSTLVKRVLTERHGYRIAVIMNEFGDTADIEAKTINVSSDAGQSEEFLELANGCLCCSIKDTGIAAIEKLMERKGAFDHILLETTGLADPGPIASMFWQNEEYAHGLGRDIYLEGVVCVVDAVFGQKQMNEDHSTDGDTGECVRQIAGSDVILLNKIDLASESQIGSLEDAIRHINPIAAVHRTSRCDIDLKFIMGIDAYSARIFDPQTPPNHSHDHASGEASHNDSTQASHYTVRGISSILVPIPSLPSQRVQLLDEWIRSVLWENRLPDSTVENPELQILRCKGMFVTDTNEIFVLQGVRSIYEMTQLDAENNRDTDSEGVGDLGKLVFIGKGLTDNVRQSLEKVVRIADSK